MKKKIKETPRENTATSIKTHLMANGMSEMGAEYFLDLNIPSLGEFRSLRDCIKENKWDEAWGFIDMYLDGVFF